MSMPPGKAASLVRPAGGRQAWSAEAPASTSASQASSSQAFDSPRQDFGSPFSPPQRQLDSFQEDQPLAKIPLSIASVVEEGDEEEEDGADEGEIVAPGFATRHMGGAGGVGGAGGAVSGGGRGEQKMGAPRGVKGRGSTGKSTPPSGRRSAGGSGGGRGSSGGGGGAALAAAREQVRELQHKLDSYETFVATKDKEINALKASNGYLQSKVDAFEAAEKEGATVRQELASHARKSAAEFQLDSPKPGGGGDPNVFG